MMSSTLLLDTVTWDLVVDNSGNIAVAGEPYSLAQDAASAIRLFEGELWYDTAQGVPYWQSILGQMPPLALMKAKFVAAAMTVPDVDSAKAFIGSITRDRIVSGQVQIQSTSGKTAAAAFASATKPVVPKADIPPMIPGTLGGFILGQTQLG